MAALTASDVTVTLTQADIDRSPDRAGFKTYPTITFGDGAKTYPSGGIPLPAKEKFGFNLEVKNIRFIQPANGNSYHYDKTNHKLRIFTATATEMSGAVAAHTLDCECRGF